MHAVVAGGSATSFDIPQAPVLISPGPWKEVEGCICAPLGFRAQGEHCGFAGIKACALWCT